MTVNFEAMADDGFTPQATESNEAPNGDDPSGKTIEFLRARLLAERAASKSARQKAQAIAEKVKDLHTRLETEIEHRKEAEAAVKKVLSVLNAKGVAVEAGNVLLVSPDLSGQPMGEAPSFVYGKEIKEVSEKVSSYIANVSIKEEVPCSVGADIQIGIVECTPAGTTKLRGNLSVVDNSCSASDSLGIKSVVRNGAVPSTNFVEHRHCPADEVQDADLEKKLVHPDYHGLPDCTHILNKDDVGTGQSFPQGLCITSKLKAMLQQIEEEVGALPEEQLLRDKLKGWVDHAANMLEDRGHKAASNRGLEVHHLGSDKQPDTLNCPSEGVIVLETKNVIHTKLPAQNKHADARGWSVTNLFPNPNAHSQQNHFVPSSGTLNTHTSEDKLLHSNLSHQRKPSCESCVAQCPPIRGPWPPQMIQYENPQPNVACPPMIPYSPISRGNRYMGSDPSYLVEAPSPKSSDTLSVRKEMSNTHGQQNEFWSSARASDLERQNAWSSVRLPRAMLSNEMSYELPMKLERDYTHQNIHFQEGHSFSHSPHSHRAGDYCTRALARQQLKDPFPFADAALSVMEDRKARLGSNLMTLDAARYCFQGEEFSGPSTPTSLDARLKRGYGYFQHDHAWRRPQVQSSHTPIVQFPHSPTSEHGYRYSSFERPCGAHRRSNSVSTNFMISEWDNSLHPRGGEVHLGNGITLFTDQF